MENAAKSPIVVMQNRSVPVRATTENTVHVLAAAVAIEINDAYRCGDTERGNRLYDRLRCLAAR